MAQTFIEDDAHLNRVVNNFFNEKNSGEYTVPDLNTLKTFTSYLLEPKNSQMKKHKVALLFICLNKPYWEFIGPAIEGAKQFFLPGHKVDYFLWSDFPLYEETKEVNYGATVFPTEPIEWPFPTLFRYNLFSQQKEKLKDYDYIFYCDADMKFVNMVGDEILGEGITAAQHPMYALRPELWMPYEPNPESAAYIKQPGRLIEKDGKKMFQPLYYAGGFQGGKSADFIKSWDVMKESIDSDLDKKNYIARWNDESHWNKYLSENPPTIVLSPSYIYPDSLINEYYTKIWGKNYSPKLITLTKKFSLTKEGGDHIKKMTENPL